MRNFKIGSGEAAQRFNGDDASAPVTWNGVESYSITSGGLRVRNVATASLPSSPPTGTLVYDTTDGVLKVWNGSGWDTYTGLGTGGYSTGSWTPTLLDSSLSASESQAYDFNTGIYTRVGNVVFLSGQIGMSSLGTLTTADAAYVGGLPVQAAASTNGILQVTRYENLNLASSGTIHGHITGGQSYAALYSSAQNLTAATIKISEISSDGAFYFAGHYFV